MRDEHETKDQIMQSREWMLLYAYEDPNHPNNTKFGEHYISPDANVSTIEAAEEHTKKYIRGQFPRKFDYFDSGAVKFKIWDASQYAQKHDKLRRNSKLDDHVRRDLGFKKSKNLGEEWCAVGLDKFCIKLNLFFVKEGQPLLDAQLSTFQYKVAIECVDEFKNGAKTVLAHLCPRFGKTIWSAAVAHELSKQLIVITSYYLTSFTSFKKDLTKFNQFAEYEHVDTSEGGNWQDIINEHLRNGKKVIAYVSLCHSKNRNNYIKWLLNNCKSDTMLIIDEADFGAHQPKQIDILAKYAQDVDTIIMTGTNIDRARSKWTIDYATSVSYLEMLAQRRKTEAGSVPIFKRKLQHFECDTQRDTLAPFLEYYQLRLWRLVASLIESGKLDSAEDFAKLPSWSKCGESPSKAKAFIQSWAKCVFLATDDFNDLNLDYQCPERADDEFRVCLVYLNFDNKALQQFARFVSEVISNAFPIIKVVNGDTIKNGKDAERECKNVINQAKENGQTVMILANKMTQRSFSLPEITEVHLAFDGGSDSTTIQRMSRVATPGNKDKIGRIFSHSFDPNRYDAIMQFIIEAVNNSRKREEIDIRELLANVYDTIDIWKCTENGSERAFKNVDEIIDCMLKHNDIQSLIGDYIDINRLDDDDIKKLASLNKTRSREKTDKQPVTEMGDTFKEKQGHQKTPPGKKGVTQKQREAAREKLKEIYLNADVLIRGTESNSIEEAMAKMHNYREDIEEKFKIDLDFLQELFNNSAISCEWINLREQRWQQVCKD